jgi:Uma2 family endonuclease
MATATESPALPAATAEPATTTTSVSASDSPYELTVDVFARMAEQGLFPRERRVYLEDGRLYEKMAKCKAHDSVGAGVIRALARRLPEGWSLWAESTIKLDERNAPLPDFSVIRPGDLVGRVDCERYPDPRDAAILIEVAVSSLRKDLTVALEKYARAGVPAYWVIDVLGRRILAHSEPRMEDGRGIYGKAETYQAGQTIPLVLDGQPVAQIPFDEILR